MTTDDDPMTSGVPVQGPDLDELEAAMNSGGQPHAYDVLALVAEVRRLREENEQTATVNARLSLSVSAVFDERDAALEMHRVQFERANRLDAALAAEQEKREALEVFARWLIAMDDPADAVALSDRQRVTLTRIINRARAALSGDTGGGE